MMNIFKAHGDEQLDDGDSGGSGSGCDDLDVGKLFADDL